MASWFSKRKALVFGGTGSLGSALVQAFKKDWEVTSVGFTVNEDAHKNILLEKDSSLQVQAETCLAQTSLKYHAIMNVAGGWTQGSIAEVEVLQQMETMNRLNLATSLLVSHIATKRLADLGLLLFSGAALPYRETTPDMLAYGISKTCSHWLALNMSVRDHIPSVSTVVTILPEGLRVQNSSASPDVDTKDWVKPEKLAILIKKWADNKNRPENGSFIRLKSEEGEVVPEYV